jgi:hypothetical protein
MHADVWPPLPYDEWRETYATLHRWMQVVGKVALATAPPINHSWGVAFLVTPRGVSTHLLPHDRRSFSIEFDLIDHQLYVRASDASAQSLPLTNQPVADFYRAVMALLTRMDLGVRIWPMPVEIPDPIRFDTDTVHHTYDRAAAHRWFQIVTRVAAVLNERRADFLGKSSPVHFFWGGFDLAVTRFSGRRAPPMPDADVITRKGYSHEVSSIGWWPGDRSTPYPAFYAYASPEPAGFATAPVRPAAAFYDNDAGQFRLKYDDARLASSPRRALLDFCQTTYEAAAMLGRWERAELEGPEI